MKSFLLYAYFVYIHIPIYINAKKKTLLYITLTKAEPYIGHMHINLIYASIHIGRILQTSLEGAISTITHNV